MTDKGTHSGEVQTESGLGWLGPLINTVELLRDFTNGTDGFEPTSRRGLFSEDCKNDERELTCGTPKLAFQGRHATSPRSASCCP